MTKEEVIENLEYQNEQFFGGQSESLKMAIFLLKENQGDWIPVTERLPENDTDVLYCSRLGTVGNCHYFNGFNNYPNTEPDHIFEDIIAWLPLPEPYKEGGE